MRSSGGGWDVMDVVTNSLAMVGDLASSKSTARSFAQKEWTSPPDRPSSWFT